MIILLSSSTSLFRFKFVSLYTMRRSLFLIWYILLCSALLKNIQKRLKWDKIKELYKNFACDEFDLFLILSQPLIFALATLYILSIWIRKFNLLSMANPSGLTNLNNSIVLSFIAIDWLIAFLIESWIKTFLDHPSFDYP